jgi:hypothetical protein
MKLNELETAMEFENSSNLGKCVGARLSNAFDFRDATVDFSTRLIEPNCDDGFYQSGSSTRG